jgi:hypothetical protein
MVSRTPCKQAAIPPGPVDKPQQIIQCKGTELKGLLEGGGENSVPNSPWEMMVLAIKCGDAGLIDALTGVPACGWETGTSTNRTASEQSSHVIPSSDDDVRRWAVRRGKRADV